jgi:hypothetical protein
VWAAVAAIATALAVFVSVFALRNQRAANARQFQLQQRLSEIEEARRSEEVAASEVEKGSSLIADVRIKHFGVLFSGLAGDSDKLRMVISNTGPAVARDVDVAIKESLVKAPSAHLGKLVEYAGPINADGTPPLEGYFELQRSNDGPLVPFILPNSEHTHEFWFRYRLFGNVGVMLTWADDRGSQKLVMDVRFMGVEET